MDLTEALIHISQCVVHVCMFVSFVVALVGAFLDLSLPASELSGFLSLNSAFVYFVAHPYWIVLDVAVPLRASFFWLVYAYALLSLLSNEVIFSGSFTHQFCHRSTCSPRSGMEHVYSFCSGFYLPTVCLGAPLPWSIEQCTSTIFFQRWELFVRQYRQWCTICPESTYLDIRSSWTSVSESLMYLLLWTRSWSISQWSRFSLWCRLTNAIRRKNL